MLLLESQVFSVLEILVQATIKNISRIMDESLLSKIKANDNLTASLEFKDQLKCVLEKQVKEAVEKICSLFSEASTHLQLQLTQTQITEHNLKKKQKRVTKKNTTPARKGEIGPTDLPRSGLTQVDRPTEVPEEHISTVSQGWREVGSEVIHSPRSPIPSVMTYGQTSVKEERAEQSSGNEMLWKETNAIACLSNARESLHRNTQVSYWNRKCKLSCKKCKRSFSKMIQLKAHQALHVAVEKLSKCSQCGKSFIKKHRLVNHQETPTGLFICCQCDTTSVDEMLQDHEKLYHKNKRLDGKPSGRSYHQVRSRRKRLPPRAAADHRSCDTCGKSFACLSNLSRHRRIHTGEKPFSCLTCGRSFNQLTTLKSHERTHTGERPFVCDSCGKGFSQANSLRLHSGWRAGQRGGQCGFSCVACGLAALCADTLKTHHRTHMGGTSISCRVCGEGLGSLGSLQAHQSRHGDRGGRLHSCLVCGKSFRSAGSLKIHERTHTGERPYSCPVCGRTFTQQNSLKSHQLSHTGERPFGCEVCGKGFSSAGNLRRHERVHTGQKPYSCSVCQHSFTQLNTLKAHMYVHTGEKRYTCDKCGRSFGYQRNLKSHKCAYNQ